MDCTGEQRFQLQGNGCSENVTQINPSNLCFLLLLLMISSVLLLVSAALPAWLHWLFHCSLKQNKITVYVKWKAEMKQQQVELLPQATGWYVVRSGSSNSGNLSCFFADWSFQLLEWIALPTGELGWLLSGGVWGWWLCPGYDRSAGCVVPQSLHAHGAVSLESFMGLKEAYLSKTCNNQ